MIRAKAFDISEHYRKYWQGTGFKAQLVAPSKAAAIRFKDVLDEIGHVSSEIVISPPDDHEGNEEIDKESKDLVRTFWYRMMEKYKSETEYNRQIIDAFKGTGDPEILIVVSKLLTGFDAPRNTVLYVCKPLKEHNLLQAIARVKADRIASATKRTITEKMEEDPAFYKKFSVLLEETIRDYREKRISEKEYLNNVVDLASRVARKDHGRRIPDAIRNDEDAQAVFGVVDPVIKTAASGGISEDQIADIAKTIVGVIRDHHIVDVWSNEVAQNNMRNAIDDYFFDVLRDEQGIALPVEQLDDLEQQIMDIARARFPG
jgi:hypothetical protein